MVFYDEGWDPVVVGGRFKREGIYIYIYIHTHTHTADLLPSIVITTATL